MRKILAPLALLVLVAGAPAAPVVAQSNGDQANAREEMRAGRNLPIREIEQRILPRYRDDEYIGFEYDPVAQAYRLKFIREGRVIWVDVDAKTARILRVSR